jgi:hypothetical protein
VAQFLMLACALTQFLPATPGVRVYTAALQEKSLGSDPITVSSPHGHVTECFLVVYLSIA